MSLSLILLRVWLSSFYTQHNADVPLRGEIMFDLVYLTAVTAHPEWHTTDKYSSLPVFFLVLKSPSKSQNVWIWLSCLKSSPWTPKQPKQVYVLLTCQQKPIPFSHFTNMVLVVCACVACRWHTCHFKALPRCGTIGTGTTVGGPRTVRYCVIVVMHNYTCRNTMASAHYNAVNNAPAPHLHLWSPFVGPACRGHFVTRSKKDFCFELLKIDMLLAEVFKQTDVISTCIIWFSF